MSDFDFTPEWYRNLNKIREAFQPAIVVSDQLKWMREIKAIKDTLTIPTAVDSIIRANQWAFDLKEIYQNNIEFFNSINSIKKQFSESLYIKSFYNFQSTLTDSLNLISKTAIATRDTSLLEALHDTTAKIAEATADIEDKDVVTKADLDQLQVDVKALGETLMGKLKEGFDGKRAQITWHLTIIGFIIGLYSLVLPYILSLKQQGKPATTEQVEAIRSDIKKLVDSALNDQVRNGFTRIAINLYLKPSGKSLCLARVGQHEKIHILFIHHKWAQVTFIDKDGLPATGWVLKKYIVNN